MTGASKIRHALAIAGCVTAFIVAACLGNVPAHPSEMKAALALLVELLAIAVVAIAASEMVSKRAWLAGAIAAAVTGWVGLLGSRAVWTPVSQESFLLSDVELIIVGAGFFALGALVVCVWRKWRPNKSPERTREG